MKSEIVSIGIQFLVFRGIFVVKKSRKGDGGTFVFVFHIFQASKSMKVDAKCSRGELAACGLPASQLARQAGRQTDVQTDGRTANQIGNFECSHNQAKNGCETYRKNYQKCHAKVAGERRQQGEGEGDTRGGR